MYKTLQSYYLRTDSSAVSPRYHNLEYRSLLPHYINLRQARASNIIFDATLGERLFP